MKKDYKIFVDKEIVEQARSKGFPLKGKVTAEQLIGWLRENEVDVTISRTGPNMDYDWRSFATKFNDWFGRTSKGGYANDYEWVLMEGIKHGITLVDEKV